MLSGLQRLLSPDIRTRAAFALLTSSTVPRYVRMAQSFGEEVAERAAAIGATVEDRITSSADLWRSLVVEAQRSETEVDLSLLLASLSTAADPRVDDLLQRLGLTPVAPSSAWVSALARSLLQRRVENEVHSIPDISSLLATIDLDVRDAGTFQTIDLLSEGAVYDPDAANESCQLEAA